MPDPLIPCYTGDGYVVVQIYSALVSEKAAIPPLCLTGNKHVSNVLVYYYFLLPMPRMASISDVRVMRVFPQRIISQWLSYSPRKRHGFC